MSAEQCASTHTLAMQNNERLDEFSLDGVKREILTAMKVVYPVVNKDTSTTVPIKARELCASRNRD